MRRALLSLVSCLVSLVSCQLTETIISAGERTMVVQMVLDPTAAQQFAVIEESSVGDSSSRFGGGSNIPPSRPRFPVTGALVTIEHLDGACPGRVETLSEVVQTPQPGQPTLPTGRYAGALTCLVPGERLGLRVTTLKGQVVTGETVIPGATARSVRIAGQAARFPMDTLRFHREHDTVRLSLDAPPGGGMQVEVRRSENLDHVSLIVLNDSLGVSFPGNLINPFENDSGETSFRAGAFYRLTVAVADSNYFDYARTFSDPITGRGFLNYLNGGIGVFGSIEPVNYVLRVVGSINEPREGAYRIWGRLGTGSPPGLVFDATFESYVDDLTRDGFSAFVKGNWRNDTLVNVSGDGYWGGEPGAVSRDANAFEFVFDHLRPPGNLAIPSFRRYLLRGTRTTDGSPFPVSLTSFNGSGTITLTGTLTGVQVSGPGTNP